MPAYEKYGPIICVAVILGILFVIWAFWGGKDYEFIGLTPLMPDIPQSYSVDSNINNVPQLICMGETSDKQNIKQDLYPEIVVDNTPTISERFIVDADESICVSKQIINSPTKIKKNYPLDLRVSDVLPIGYDEKPNGGPLKRRGKGRFISRGERLCCQTLERIYGVKFVSTWPDWLRNPETGETLELDCYNDDLKIAVEYNGEQHYKWPNFTKQSYVQFINQIRRDELKRQVCDRNDVYLITVPYNVGYEKIPSYIMSHLPETIQTRLEEEGTLDNICTS